MPGSSSARLSRKGQVTIPVEIRRRLGVGPGDRVRFVIEPGGARMEPDDARADVERIIGLGSEVWSAEGGAARVIAQERSSWRD